MVVTRMRMPQVLNGRRRGLINGWLMMMAPVRTSRRDGCRSRRRNGPTWILTSVIRDAVTLSAVMPAVTGCHVQPRGSMPRSDQTANKHNEGGSDQRAHGAIRVESSEKVKWSDQGLLMRLVRYGAAFCSSSCEMFPTQTSIQFRDSTAGAIAVTASTGNCTSRRRLIGNGTTLFGVAFGSRGRESISQRAVTTLQYDHDQYDRC